MAQRIDYPPQQSIIGKSAPSTISAAGTGAGLPILLAVSILFVVGGMMSLSQATLGVGSVAIGCAFGIFARIVQAGRQHQAMIDALQVIHNQQAPSAGSFSTETISA